MLPVTHHHHYPSIVIFANPALSHSNRRQWLHRRYVSLPPTVQLTPLTPHLAHIIEQLLANGHSVVTTVRSEAKAQPIRDAHGARIQVELVPDMTTADAFDAVTQIPGLEAVIHTASPFHYNWTDPQELIGPAVNGTKGILAAIKRNALGVRRVVVTSSFAAIVDADKTTDPGTIFTEASFNPTTIADIHKSQAHAYRASKTLAEKAAWDFVAEEKPNFDLATVNPPFVFGPVVHHLATVDAMNTSNERLVKILRGEWKTEIPATVGVNIWVDVRDVALAHVAAVEKPEASGKRLFTTAGRFSNRELVRIVRERFPEFKDKVAGEEVEGGEGAPEDKVFGFDNGETTALLGGIGWRSLEECVVDFTDAVKGMDL